MALPMRPSGAMRVMRIGWSAVRMRRRLAKPFLQRQRGGGRPDLRAVDHEDVGVASILLPLAGARRVALERGVVIAPLHPFVPSLHPRAGEGCGVPAAAPVIVGGFENNSD